MTQHTDPSVPNAELVLKFLDLLDRHEFEAAEALLSPGFVLHLNDRELNREQTMAMVRGLLSYDNPQTYEQMFVHIDRAEVVLVSGEAGIGKTSLVRWTVWLLNGGRMANGASAGSCQKTKPPLFGPSRGSVSRTRSGISTTATPALSRRTTSFPPGRTTPPSPPSPHATAAATRTTAICGSRPLPDRPISWHCCATDAACWTSSSEICAA